MKNIHNLKLVQQLFDRQMTGKLENKRTPSNQYIQCNNASLQSVRRKTKIFFLSGNCDVFFYPKLRAELEKSANILRRERISRRRRLPTTPPSSQVRTTHFCF